MKIKLVYTGTRLSPKGKNNYRYLDPEKEEIAYFSSILAGVNTIGMMIEAEQENSRYSKIKAIPEKYGSEDQLLQWGIEHRSALEEKYKYSRIKSQDAFEKLVGRMKSQMGLLTIRERMRVARWVFEQLIK